MNKMLAGALALVMASGGTGLQAAYKNYKGYNFTAHVLKGDGGYYREFGGKNKPTLKVRDGEEYSVVIRNPLPVRVGVALSIDGLNSIDGDRTTPGEARKWIIEPNSSITIKGWQISGSARKNFVFTGDSESYAKWREDKSGKPYTANLGVIGLAWFWNDQELDRALNPPQPFDEPAELKACEDRAAGAPSAARGEKKSRAGTGMGREQAHYVRKVEFDGNVGMFKVRDVMKIYYEFADDPPAPSPFVDDEADDLRFAPVMD